MALGLQGGAARTGVFLSLEVLLRTFERSLCSPEVGRCPLRGPGDAGRGDRLARVAHLLDRGSAAAGKARNTDKHNE